MTETWRPTARWPQYEVSDLGRVRRVKPGRGARSGHILSGRPSRKGYLRVVLHVGSSHHEVSVHSLVAEAFIGLRPDGGEVNHKNGVKADNRAENLEWVTPSGNARHAVATGLRPPQPGESNGRAKLTDREVGAIRGLRGRMTNRDLGRRFGVSDVAVSLIQRGRTWTHVPPSDFDEARRVLTARERP